MKTNRWKIFPFLFALILSSCTSCDDPDPTVLPAETQSGKNTFGCYVDGKVFLGGSVPSVLTPPLYAEYDRRTGILIIAAKGKINNTFAGIMALEVLNPITDTTLAMKSAIYDTSKNNDYCVAYGTFNNGDIYITKLDTINNIISGRFSFIGTCLEGLENETDSTISVSITEGRFDIKTVFIY